MLDHLAGCANLRQAAEAAGISTRTVNYHQRKYPDFAQAVDEALAVGCRGLRAAMIARALTELMLGKRRALPAVRGL